MKELMKTRLSTKGRERQKTLRMSNIGKPLRQLYYDLKGTHEPEKLEPHVLLKFMYGDIIEEMVLFLAEQAGHEVSEQQKTVGLDGVVGHIDAVIDGHLIDVKSASKFAFKKFEEGTLAQDDPFGYMKQLSGYAASDELKDEIKGAGFLAVNKELGKVTLLSFSQDEMKMEMPARRIEAAREVLTKEDPPERCYDKIPEGKSGNHKLPVGCSYCSHKFECWKDSNGGKGLRTFLYSFGPVFLTDVKKEPRVLEKKD